MYERYCALRDSRGLKDSKIAGELKITPSTFSDWKKGKSSPNADKLVKIARYLGTTVEYLVTGEESEPAAFPISDDEKILISDYRRLNSKGKENLKEHMKLLVGNDEYIKDTAITRTNAG